MIKWGSDLVVEIAIVVIKFPGSQVRLHIPAFHVIIHSYLWEPLGHGIDGATFHIQSPHSVHSFYRNPVSEVHGNCGGTSPGRDRLVEVNLHPGIVDVVLGGAAAFYLCI